jgi:hypothetical protein
MDHQYFRMNILNVESDFVDYEMAKRNMNLD